MSKEIITEQFANSYADKVAPWGFNGLGYIVYKRTYSRIKPDGTNEEWHETIRRCINGAQEIGAKYTQQEAERLFDLMFNLKCNMAGRMLWQLGTDTVRRWGGNSLLNCWFIQINELEAFPFIFENLMMGGGVGFSIRKEDVHELPRVKQGVVVTNKNEKDADFIVPDSREGWVALLKQILDAYFVTGKSFCYSTQLVRGYGERINGFGGTASGPAILVDGMDKICKVLDGRKGKKLRSIDVLDVCNIIGSIVVAGNVRRSAQIALGDPDDHHFLRAKNWSDGAIPNWRAMSNNTIYADSYSHISDQVWNNGYTVDETTGCAKGEPYGFFNLPLSQKYGRLCDGPMADNDMYPQDEDNAIGTNPCAEISLASGECCNLAELYINNIASKEEMIECATLLYKTQKAIINLPFLHATTNTITKKNQRLGLGITGVCQAIDKLEWLDDVYKALRAFDRQWSKANGYNESIKLTTVKPSGTLSLLAGATPGVHPAISEFYIRRIRISSADPLVAFCRKQGYYVEYLRSFDGSEDRNTVVVEFPCECKNALYAENMGVIQQLEMVKLLQSKWADNAVSVTAYYDIHELDALKKWMSENYECGLKSVSFLLRSKHGFIQAPYEEIPKEIYTALVKGVKPLKPTTANIGMQALDGVECAGGACPIR